MKQKPKETKDKKKDNLKELKKIEKNFLKIFKKEFLKIFKKKEIKKLITQYKRKIETEMLEIIYTYPNDFLFGDYKSNWYLYSNYFLTKTTYEVFDELLQKIKIKYTKDIAIHCLIKLLNKEKIEKIYIDKEKQIFLTETSDTQCYSVNELKKYLKELDQNRIIFYIKKVKREIQNLY